MKNKIFSQNLTVCQHPVEASIFLSSLFFYHAWPYKKVEKRYEISCVCQTNNSCRHRKPHC